MFQNAGFISLMYPCSMFGYALLEESRPRKAYWDFIRSYTIFVMISKFVCTLNIFGPYMKENATLMGYLKPGYHDYENVTDRMIYMSPEILITALIMLNEIRLKLYGLYYVIENDIETINDGVQRHLSHGDLE